MTQSPQPPIVPGQTQPAYYPPQPPPPKRRIHPLSVVFFAAGLIMFFIGVISTASGGTGATPTTVSSPSPVVVYVTQPGAATAAAATKPAPLHIEDGVWTVGTDLPAGRYRATANVSSGCYWSITKSGTNGETIIANDIPGGGRPSVTLKAGQDFTSQECGTWAKIA